MNDWEHLKAYGYAPGNYLSRCHRCNEVKGDLDKRATSCRPCAEAVHAKRATEPAVGLLVWFRPGRMYGQPERQPSRAMVTSVRPDGRVNLEIGCEDMSEVFGTAGAVPHRDSLPQAQRDQLACWWTA